MGIRPNELASLLNAWRDGIEHASVVTVGRQQLMLNQRPLSASLKRFGVSHQTPQITDILRREAGRDYAYAEKLLQLLGAKSVRSIDASAYEGCTDIVDLCLPLPDQLRGKFDLAIDFGTLEHVFDVSTALHSILSLVKSGGHYLACLPANNQMRHGFYQFSPEFFYSTLVPENGFKIERLWLFEDLNSNAFYEVPNPIRERRRIELCNSTPMSIYVLARKVGETPARLRAYQSDYVATWNADKEQ